MSSHMITVDATGKPLGRLASRVALLLRGKQSPRFRPHLAPTQKVRVTNIAKIQVTQRKLEQKKYYRSSGHPGSLKAIPMGTVFAKDPTAVFVRTVKGMLPATKQRNRMIMNLTVE